MASRGLRQEGNDGPMHDRLRRVLLRALHPDSQAHDEAARRVMDEVFRTLWPKVTRILEGKPDEGPAEVETHTSPAYPQPENRG